MFPGEKPIVVDLETLGTKPNSGILAIGATTLDYKYTFYRTIKKSSLDFYHFGWSADTMKWWHDQPAHVREEAFNGTTPIRQALREFQDWLYTVCKDKAPLIIGNGAAFDNVILKHAYDKVDLTVPWSYKNDFCYRTLRKVLGDRIKEPEFVGDKHNALSDAIHEAKILNLMLEKLYGKA